MDIKVLRDSRRSFNERICYTLNSSNSKEVPNYKINTVRVYDRYAFLFKEIQNSPIEELNGVYIPHALVYNLIDQIENHYLHKAIVEITDLLKEQGYETSAIVDLLYNLKVNNSQLLKRREGLLCFNEEEEVIEFYAPTTYDFDEYGFTICEARLSLTEEEKQSILNNLFEEGFKKRLLMAKKNISVTKKQITEHKKAISTMEMNLESDELFLSNIEKNRPSVNSTLEKIHSLPLVENVVLINKSLIVRTKEIYLQNEEVWGNHFFGIYDIVVDLMNINRDNIRFINRCLTVKDYAHPHILGNDTSPCWGGWTSSIVELCSTNYLPQLIRTCINFLSHCDEREYEAGANYYYYPDVEYSEEEELFVEDIIKKAKAKPISSRIEKGEAITRVWFRESDSHPFV